MSKPTESFWHGLGWGLIWLGFFGGIALWVWAVSLPDQPTPRELCIIQHGTWNRVGSGWDAYYRCEFKEQL